MPYVRISHQSTESREKNYGCCTLFLTLPTAQSPSYKALISYVHWNKSEASGRIAPMTRAGRDVRMHWSIHSSRRLNGDIPDGVAISLDRLPSHGRAVAEWFWEAKSRRHIPIVFEGGRPDKVVAARGLFPEARFRDTEQAIDALKRLLTAGGE